MIRTGVRPRSAASPARMFQAWAARAAVPWAGLAAERGDDGGEDAADPGGRVADVDDGVPGGVQAGDGGPDGGGLAGPDLAGDHADGPAGDGPGDAGGGLGAVGVPVQPGRGQVAAERHPGQAEPGGDGVDHERSFFCAAGRR